MLRAKSRISARVIAHSISGSGKQLITFVLLYPRFIHSELMTHRVFSRNAASSRAIPVKKMMAQVLHDPAMPIFWGANQPGMQARAQLSGWRLSLVQRLWLLARYPALFFVWLFTLVGLHKQIANRILEPWMWMQTILTGTEFENFYGLRDHEDAQPEFGRLALCMRAAHAESTPKLLQKGEWHLPFVDEKEQARGTITLPGLIKICVARCARVSFLNHEGRVEYAKDWDLHDDLRGNGHMSPLEHAATPLEDPTKWSGNLKGWEQYRKTMKDEAIYVRPLK